jgi:hypothetical protein
VHGRVVLVGEPIEVEPEGRALARVEREQALEGARREEANCALDVGVCG